MMDTTRPRYKLPWLPYTADHDYDVPSNSEVEEATVTGKRTGTRKRFEYSQSTEFFLDDLFLVLYNMGIIMFQVLKSMILLILMIFISELTNEINSQISNDKTGRLFAVVQIAGKQFKITDSDIIIIQGYSPPTAGDQIKLEKILLLGSSDFTLVGRPILDKNLVSIDATVVEKNMSSKKIHFIFRKKKQTRTINCE